MLCYVRLVFLGRVLAAKAIKRPLPVLKYRYSSVTDGLVIICRLWRLYVPCRYWQWAVEPRRAPGRRPESGQDSDGNARQLPHANALLPGQSAFCQVSRSFVRPVCLLQGFIDDHGALLVHTCMHLFCLILSWWRKAYIFRKLPIFHKIWLVIWTAYFQTDQINLPSNRTAGLFRVDMRLLALTLIFLWRLLLKCELFDIM